MAIEDATAKITALAQATAGLNQQLAQTVALSGAIIPPNIPTPPQFRPITGGAPAPGPTVNRGTGMDNPGIFKSSSGGRGGVSADAEYLGRKLDDLFKSSGGIGIRTGANR